MTPRELRSNFIQGLRFGLRVVSPVLWALVALITGLGVVVGRIEGWSLLDSIYFAFVSGLTIGYGDFAPKAASARLLAILIGLCGVMLTSLIAAVAVKSLTGLTDAERAAHKG